MMRTRTHEAGAIPPYRAGTHELGRTQAPEGVSGPPCPESAKGVSTRAAGMTCSQCGNTLLWWRSRTGHRLCMRCHPDPWQALEALLRAMAQGCAEVAEAGRPS
jgi:hypothetical protein